jgi:hypothetical protein
VHLKTPLVIPDNPFETITEYGKLLVKITNCPIRKAPGRAVIVPPGNPGLGEW